MSGRFARIDLKRKMRCIKCYTLKGFNVFVQDFKLFYVCMYIFFYFKMFTKVVFSSDNILYINRYMFKIVFIINIIMLQKSINLKLFCFLL